MNIMIVDIGSLHKHGIISSMLKLIFKDQKRKYTCDCCGHKTLPSNEMGEICAVCFWEEGYDSSDDLFGFSSTNRMTLYQAQENYKIFGCSKNKWIKHCRKPFSHEEKDLNWHSIQNIIENKYSTSQLIDEIHKCGEFLKQPDSVIVYKNFKSLPELDITRDDEELELEFLEFGVDFQFDNFKHELELKSLLIALYNKKNTALLLRLFDEYYQKGLCYYIAWSIMLFVLTHSEQLELHPKIIDIFLDIEINNYYGVDSLGSALKQYWHMKRKAN
ncbi:MAG: hypothetical protein Tsb005_20140 [Gammaproteobacteria bacterium]